MKNMFTTIFACAALVAGVLFTTSLNDQKILGALNCNEEFTDCHGGSGYGAGGSGGHFEIKDSSYIQSGGGGSSFLPGGGGSHLVNNFDTNILVRSGGSSDVGGGHTTCDLSGSEGAVCETKGRPQ